MGSGARAEQNAGAGGGPAEAGTARASSSGSAGPAWLAGPPFSNRPAPWAGRQRGAGDEPRADAALPLPRESNAREPGLLPPGDTGKASLKRQCPGDRAPPSAGRWPWAPGTSPGDLCPLTDPLQCLWKKPELMFSGNFHLFQLYIFCVWNNTVFEYLDIFSSL